MAKKKAKKKRDKKQAQSKGAPTFEMKQSVPKIFGAAGNAGAGKGPSATRAPGSQRKR